MSEEPTFMLTHDKGPCTFSIIKYAGCYRIGDDGVGACFYLEKKPRWFHRKMMKLCLGWEWRDNK